jgi:glutathione peroxidase
MAKIQVNGQDADPLYKYLKQRAKGIFGSTSIKWNFTKFIINRNGSVVVRYSPLTKPLRFEIGIQSLLNE